MKSCYLLLALSLTTLLTTSCIGRRPLGSFQVLPNTPDYLLRSPDSQKTPFPEILVRYNHFVPGHSWMDLHSRMELRVENAYYQQGAPKRGLNGYLGTESARYTVRPQGGLRLLSMRSMKERPPDQPPVQRLIARPQKHYRYYRFYYEVFLKRAGARGSVLLGANSTEELDRLTAQLQTAPDSVCGDRSRNCTVFPEACSVSIEMQIVVNGEPRSVQWGTSLGSVAVQPRHLELLRAYAGRLMPVKIDASDPEALRLPLLPGDDVTWN
jgi:hypothetical protein